MLAEITAGFGSLQAAISLIQGINAANAQANINEVKISLQKHIFEANGALMAAQTAQVTALDKIRDLEQEIMRLKDWEAEKQRYELKAIDRGAVAYMPKPGMESGEPAHWLCANCFAKGQKSFLQSKGVDTSDPRRSGSLAIYGCDACHASLKIYYTRKPSEPYSEPS